MVHGDIAFTLIKIMTQKQFGSEQNQSAFVTKRFLTLGMVASEQSIEMDCSFD